MTHTRIKIRKIDEQPDDFYVEVLHAEGRDRYHTPEVRVGELEVEEANEVVLSGDANAVEINIEDDHIRINS